MLAIRLSILDTGARPNFVRADTLPQGYEKNLEYGPLLAIADANGRPLRMSGELMLTVRLGSRIVRNKLLVCERLAAPVILGFDFNDRFVEAIFPRKRFVELDDGTRVPIVRRSLPKGPNAPPMPPRLVGPGKPDAFRLNLR